MSATRQHRPTAELRAIQPTPARGIQLRLSPETAARVKAGADLLDDRDEIARVAHNIEIAKRANWSGPNRAVRRQYGVSRGSGFQRLTAAGRHVRGPHAPNHRPAQPEEAVAA